MAARLATIYLTTCLIAVAARTIAADTSNEVRTINKYVEKNTNSASLQPNMAAARQLRDSLAGSKSQDSTLMNTLEVLLALGEPALKDCTLESYKKIKKAEVITSRPSFRSLKSVFKKHSRMEQIVASVAYGHAWECLPMYSRLYNDVSKQVSAKSDKVVRQLTDAIVVGSIGAVSTTPLVDHIYKYANKLAQGDFLSLQRRQASTTARQVLSQLLGPARWQQVSASKVEFGSSMRENLIAACQEYEQHYGELVEMVAHDLSLIDPGAVYQHMQAQRELFTALGRLLVCQKLVISNESRLVKL